jgi:hypothetical protein
MNLLPATVLKRRQRQRVGWYAGAAFAGVVASLLATGWFYDQVASAKRQSLESEKRLLERLQSRDQQFRSALAQRDRGAQAAHQLTTWMAGRFYWADLLTDLRRVLEATETATSRGQIRTGVWIESMAPELPEEPVAEESAPSPGLDPRFWTRYLGSLPGLPPGWESRILAARQGSPDGEPTTAKPDVAATNKISTIQLTCRAISWKRVSPAADSELAYTFLRQLQASPFAAGGTNGTSLSGLMQQDETTGTFSFNAKLVLKDPIQL